MPADGAGDIPGWREAVHGGWFGGKEMLEPAPPEDAEIASAAVEGDTMEVDEEPLMEDLPTSKKKGKRKSMAADPLPSTKVKVAKKGKKPRQTM